MAVSVIEDFDHNSFLRRCFVTGRGSENQPVIRTGAELEGYSLDLSTAGAALLAEAIGWRSPETVARYRDEVESLKAEVRALHAVLQKARDHLVYEAPEVSTAAEATALSPGDLPDNGRVRVPPVRRAA